MRSSLLTAEQVVVQPARMPPEDKPALATLPDSVVSQGQARLLGQSYNDRVIPENQEIRDADCRHLEFRLLGAKGVRFIKCRFDYSIFTHGYFRNAQFDECSFLGCRFDDCNFRNATFSKCNFSYSFFTRTHIEVDAVLYQTPSWPNMRREFGRNLRMNAASLGDAEGERRCFEFEMEQESIVFRESARGREDYYKKHRGLSNRVKFSGKLALHNLSDHVWGHGEAPSRIFRFALEVMLFLTVLWTYFLKPDGITDLTVGELLEEFMDAGSFVALIMLGNMPNNLPVAAPNALAIMTSLSGYVIFGLLLVATAKRYAKR